MKDLGYNVADFASAAVSAYSAGHLASPVAVADSAADVASNLDGLESLAAASKLSSITLTDGGTPTISVTATQLAQDAPALNAIAGSYTLNVPGVSSGAAAFVVQQDASGRGANGILLDYPGTAPSGGNSVIGFQNASFASGDNAVVLNGPRSEYAVQVNPSGTLTLVDTTNNDASATISGATYLLFNGAGSQSGGVYSNMYFIETPTDVQLAELYQAAFHRQPDLVGLDYWTSQLASGNSLRCRASPRAF